MTHYVCDQLSDTTPQTCVSWSEQVTVLDQVAITKAQARELTVEICTILIMAYCYQLFKQFMDKNT